MTSALTPRALADLQRRLSTLHEQQRRSAAPLAFTAAPAKPRDQELEQLVLHFAAEHGGTTRCDHADAVAQARGEWRQLHDRGRTTLGLERYVALSLQRRRDDGTPAPAARFAARAAAPSTRDAELAGLAVHFQASTAADHAAVAAALAEHRELRARGLSSLTPRRYVELALERARRA